MGRPKCMCDAMDCLADRSRFKIALPMPLPPVGGFLMLPLPDVMGRVSTLPHATPWMPRPTRLVRLPRMLGIYERSPQHYLILHLLLVYEKHTGTRTFFNVYCDDHDASHSLITSTQTQHQHQHQHQHQQYCLKGCLDSGTAKCCCGHSQDCCTGSLAHRQHAGWPHATHCKSLDTPFHWQMWRASVREVGDCVHDE